MADGDQGNGRQLNVIGVLGLLLLGAIASTTTFLLADRGWRAVLLGALTVPITVVAVGIVARRLLRSRD